MLFDVAVDGPLEYVKECLKASLPVPVIPSQLLGLRL